MSEKPEQSHPPIDLNDVLRRAGRGEIKNWLKNEKARLDKDAESVRQIKETSVKHKHSQQRGLLIVSAFLLIAGLVAGIYGFLFDSNDENNEAALVLITTPVGAAAGVLGAAKIISD